MVVPSPNTRVVLLSVGDEYWCSSWFGLDFVALLSLNDTHATVRHKKQGHITIRLSDSTFFYSKPVR